MGIVNHRFPGNWHILKTTVKSPARVKELWEPYGELDGLNRKSHLDDSEPDQDSVAVQHKITVVAY